MTEGIVGRFREILGKDMKVIATAGTFKRLQIKQQ
jgi:hypothetical protein